MDKFLNKLGELDTTTLSDALDALDLPGAIPNILPVTVKGKICGLVKTVRLGPASEKKSSHHLGTTAIAAASPEHIIFIDNQGRADCSSWGGLLSLAAQKRGVRGVITHGFCRDIDEIAEMDFAIFARGVTPISARGRAVEVETEGVIYVGGVAVKENDYTVADQSGVVVIAREKISQVLKKAEEIQSKENSMAEQLKTSSEPHLVLGANYDNLTERKK